MIPFQQTAAGCGVEGLRRDAVRVGHVEVGIQLQRHRLSPWLAARVPRFGRFPMESAPEVLDALVEWTRSRPVGRLDVEVWNERQEARGRMADLLLRRGFSPKKSYRSYAHTVWLDLGPPESDILAGFHPSTRRHVRATQRRGYDSLPVTEPGLGPHLGSLIRESFRRTGGVPPALDWAGLIRESRRPDSQVHVLGLFRQGAQAPHGLVSFAVAYLHGEVAEYAHAGAHRTGESVPLLYAPTWELIRWARSRGARAWDFGGVHEWGNRPALDGIRDFKRSFSRKVVQVGEEWTLRGQPFRMALSRFRSR